jgi:hypothetical protein
MEQTAPSRRDLPCHTDLAHNDPTAASAADATCGAEGGGVPSDHISLNVAIPTWDGERRLINEMWRMQKGQQIATCELWTHPDGGELRLVVDGRVKVADVNHQGFVIDVLIFSWIERMHLRSWRELRDASS